MVELLKPDEIEEFKEWMKKDPILPSDESSYINYFIKQKFESNLDYTLSRFGLFVVTGDRPLDKSVFGYKMLKKGGVLFTSPNFSIDLIEMQVNNVEDVLIVNIYDSTALDNIYEVVSSAKNKTIVIDNITTILRFFKVDKLKSYPDILEDIRDASVKNNNKVFLITEDYTNFETNERSTMSDKLLNFLADYKLDIIRSGPNILVHSKYPIEFKESLNRL